MCAGPAGRHPAGRGGSGITFRREWDQYEQLLLRLVKLVNAGRIGLETSKSRERPLQKHLAVQRAACAPRSVPDACSLHMPVGPSNFSILGDRDSGLRQNLSLRLGKLGQIIGVNRRRDGHVLVAA